VKFDGKYRKCQENIIFFLINPYPGNPGLISRKSGNKIIVKSGMGNPGNETLPESSMHSGFSSSSISSWLCYNINYGGGGARTVEMVEAIILECTEYYSM
jgi:hypothetical protein